MKKIFLFSLLVIVLSVLPAGGALAADAPEYGGIAKWHVVPNPPMLDPHMATDTTSARAYILMFDTLVTNSDDGQKILPWLAESWSVSPDSKVWTFKLRKGVHFHKETEGGKPTANGGREVTAEDWKWSFERMIRDKSPRAYFIDMIEGYQEMADGKAREWKGVKAVDKYTLQFTLREPFAPFISVLAYQALCVVPKEDVMKHGKDFKFHPVGTGAFTFESWKQDQKVTLNRNPNYWRKDAEGRQLPYLDGFEIVVIPESTVAWEEFKKGNINFINDVPERQVKEARELLGDNFLFAPQPGIYYFGFNMTKEPFKNNKKLRQAMNYAIDRVRMNDLVMEGLFMPATGVMPPSMPGFNKNLKGYDYNPEKAKQLLAEAGYPNGLEVTIQVNQSARNKAIAEAAQAQLAEIGIKMNIKIVDWGVHLDMLDRGECEMYRMGWVVDYLDPDNFLYVNLSSRNLGIKGNYSNYKNDEVDKLLNEARVISDQKKRIAMYQKAEEIIVDDAPWLFLFYYGEWIATQKYVRNAVLPAFGAYSMRMDDIWFSKTK